MLRFFPDVVLTSCSVPLLIGLINSRQSSLYCCVLQGKGNKIMDQIFDTFMAELREAKGDKKMVTDLCQAKELSPSKVSTASATA